MGRDDRLRPSGTARFSCESCPQSVHLGSADTELGRQPQIAEGRFEGEKSKGWERWERGEGGEPNTPCPHLRGRSPQITDLREDRFGLGRDWRDEHEVAAPRALSSEARLL